MAFDTKEVTYNEEKIQTTAARSRRGRPKKKEEDKKAATSVTVTFSEETYDTVTRYANLVKVSKSRIVANSTVVSPYIFLTPLELGELESKAEEQGKSAGQLVAEIVKEALNGKEKA